MDGELRDGFLKDNVFKLDVVHHPLAACSNPVVLLAAFVTCIAIALSGALGYVLGQQAGGKVCHSHSTFDCQTQTRSLSCDEPAFPVAALQNC